MTRKTGSLTLALTICGLAAPAAMAQVGGPVQKGDIAFGLSQFDSTLSAQLVRGAAHQGDWTTQNFLQSMEFDNLGGNSHNARGNLLCLNFGSASSGGTLWSLATDGSDVATQLYAFDGTNETLTRIGGLSVSPDNTKLAQIGNDSGSLIVLAYTAGDGSGNGSAGPLLEETFFAATGATQGTTWLDNNTVLAFLPGFTIGDADLVSYDVNTNNTTVLTTITGLAGGSAFTDIDYNPMVSPFVYAAYSSFDGATHNTLAVFDPTDWSLVNRIDLSVSIQTTREVALGFNNNTPTLFVSSFGGDNADPGPWIETLDITDPSLLTDDSSVDFYRADPIDSAFNGIDYALTESGGPSDCLTLDVQNLVAGDRAVFTVSGGTPGVRGVTVYGLQAGSTVVNNVAGYCATFGIKGVRQDKVLGGLNKSFDANGEISFGVPIPANSAGTAVLFQSAMRGTCPGECISNLVQAVVQ